MFSQNKIGWKGRYSGHYCVHAKRRNIISIIFSLRFRIWIRMCETREGIACPLFSLKGSMTVETALILPMFLLAVFTLLSSIDVMKMTIEQQMQQHEMLRNAAVSAPFLDTVVQGREGDCIKLDYLYAQTLPAGGFGHKKVLVNQRALVHIFNGYDDSHGDTIGMQDVYVYVTKRGSVYHKKRSCSALQISIRQVFGKKITKERNTEGKIYRTCKKCTRGYSKAELSMLPLFVTDYGVKYHVRANCPELLRTVKMIRIEEAGGRRACKICG